MIPKIRIIDLGMVNAFLAKAGDGFVLIDTGMSRHWARLEAELLKAECLPSRLKLVVITHGDFDHTGNCAILQKKYGAKIAMQEGDLSVVQNGIPPEHKAESFAGKVILFLAKLANSGTKFNTFEPDIILSDGQSFGDYGFDARVIHTPGHTNGSIAILTGRGELLAGDTVSNRIKPGLAPFIQDRTKLEASLAILKSLKAETVYPGHGKPFAFEELLKIS